MPNCPMCRCPFDLEGRRAIILPGGQSFCKACLRDVMNLSAEAQGEELPELPDDVLLHLFSYLSNRDLLRGVRGVCRRWRDLVLHPSLWKHRDFPDGSCSCCLLSSALQLLPRARSLSLSLNSVPLKMWVEAYKSACAFASLKINFSESGGVRPVRCALALLKSQVRMQQKQLQTLILKELPIQDAAEELIATAVAGGLTTLEMSVHYPTMIPFADQMLELKGRGASQTRASLKHFNHTGIKQNKRAPTLYRLVSDPTAELVIAAHSSTLETVQLSGGCRYERAIELLGSCPLLREAHVPGVKEVAHLSSCTLLTSLALGSERDRFTSLPVSFFRDAAHRLTKLTMEHSDVGDGPVMEALGALAASGESALEELYISSISRRDSVRPLPGLLPGLPHLHTLHIPFAPPAKALDDIHPSIIPNLKLLRFTPRQVESVFCRPECPFPALYRLVQRCPQLHIEGLWRFHECRGDCVCCQSKVHARVPSEWADSNREYDELCLFGHAPTEECWYDQDHESCEDPFSDWVIWEHVDGAETS